MRAKVILPALAILILGGIGFYLIRSHTLYLSHAAVVDETIAALLNACLLYTSSPSSSRRG